MTNVQHLGKIIRAIINEELDKRFPKPAKQELPNIKEITANSAYQGPYTKPFENSLPTPAQRERDLQMIRLWYGDGSR